MNAGTLIGRITHACGAFAAALLALGMPPAHAEGIQGWEVWMREPASPVYEGIYDLHYLLTVIMAVVVVVVLALLLYVMIRFRESANPTPATWSHNTTVEVIWTLIPVLILVGISVPSFNLLYFMDKTTEPDLTIKITGYQWYWEYEYPDEQIGFIANMIQDADLKEGQPRLLATDNHVVVPVGKNVQVLLTAADVLHAWAVPELGVKKDAVPGRLNETWFRVDRPGIYYGQCSELCGRLHGFMPITIEAVSDAEYEAWLTGAKEEFGLADAGLDQSVQVAAR